MFDEAFLFDANIFGRVEKYTCGFKFCIPLIISDEPHRDKTNKMACAPSEDSYQPGHPPSLIRVFAVRLKGTITN